MKKGKPASRVEQGGLALDPIFTNLKRILSDSKPVRIDTTSSATADATGEATITLIVQGAAKRYAVDVKSRIRSIVDLTQYAGVQVNGALPCVLIAPYLTRMLAETCVELGIQFIDLAGNMHLFGRDYFVCVLGKTPDRSTKMLIEDTGSTGRSATSGSLRIIFALLTMPGLITKSQRAIAEAAGVANGAVGPVLADFEKRGLVVSKNVGAQRKLLDVGFLESEWSASYPLRLRPKLHLQRFTASKADWWEGTTLPEGVWWSGEVAAALITRDLRPEKFSLYVDPSKRAAVLPSLAKAARLRADPNGNVEILDSFWFPGAPVLETQTVPLLLTYADLLNTRDGRNLAAARLLMERMRGDR